VLPRSRAHNILTEVVCPHCGGRVLEEFDAKAGYAAYHCGDCGYASNTDVADDPRLLGKYVSKKLVRFVKWIDIGIDRGLLYVGSMPWWPETFGGWAWSENRIVPVVRRGKLWWRRRDKLKTGKKGKKPVHWSRTYADYLKLSQARDASKQSNRVLATVQRTAMRRKSDRPLMRLRDVKNE
jgi:ribosomal protein S27AE